MKCICHAHDERTVYLFYSDGWKWKQKLEHVFETICIVYQWINGTDWRSDLVRTQRTHTHTQRTRSMHVIKYHLFRSINNLNSIRLVLCSGNVWCILRPRTSYIINVNKVNHMKLKIENTFSVKLNSYLIGLASACNILLKPFRWLNCRASLEKCIGCK